MQFIISCLALAVFMWPVQLVAADAPVAAARTLVLVRHGHHSIEPAADPAKGPPLTSLGRAQAKLAAERLRASPYALDTVVASPMLRSQETAQAIVAVVPGVRLVTLSDLTECTPPMAPGQVVSINEPASLTACAEQFDRVYDAYFRPGERAGSGQVLVAHANVIRYLVTKALGMDPKAWSQFSIGHSSMTTLRIGSDGSVVVLGVGDIGHVPVNQRSGSIIDADSNSRRRR
jgi:serine/threonine-protein phosphatase PGAM5